MATSNRKLTPITASLIRGVIGFIAGGIFSSFVLVFSGHLPTGHARDLNTAEIERQSQSLWLLFYIAVASGLVAMMFGRIRLSKFWLWFVVAFGIICVIPFWPHKDGSLLPFATPYVNFGFQSGDALVLMIHVSAAVLLAGIIHWLWPKWRQHTRAI